MYRNGAKPRLNKNFTEGKALQKGFIMKKKNYVYKVMFNGACYTNLEAAAGDAFLTMTHRAKFYGSQLTNPIVIKVPGGYAVKAFTKTGKVLTRRIDVFVPADHSKNKAVIHYLAARHSSPQL